MDKRIHTKRSANLTYRHYLFHFKWPLLGLSFLLILLTINPMNFTSYFFSSNEYQENIEILFTDAIYPIDVLNQDNPNENILYYLKKKDELKSIEDVKSINKKQKVILPLIKNKSSSNSYLILEFTHVFFHPRFCSNTKEEIFGKKCPFTNCEYTCDLKHEKDADLLLMHKRDLNSEKLATMKRNSEQIWLLWHDESNEKSAYINKYKFNWTITYRISAEASLGAYGITIVKPKKWSNKQLNSWINEQFKKRYNQAVW